MLFPNRVQLTNPDPKVRKVKTQRRKIGGDTDSVEETDNTLDSVKILAGIRPKPTRRIPPPQFVATLEEESDEENHQPHSSPISTSNSSRSSVGSSSPSTTEPQQSKKNDGIGELLNPAPKARKKPQRRRIVGFSSTEDEEDNTLENVKILAGIRPKQTRHIAAPAFETNSDDSTAEEVPPPSLQLSDTAITNENEDFVVPQISNIPLKSRGTSVASEEAAAKSSHPTKQELKQGKGGSSTSSTTNEEPQQSKKNDEHTPESESFVSMESSQNQARIADPVMDFDITLYGSDLREYLEDCRLHFFEVTDDQKRVYSHLASLTGSGRASSIEKATHIIVPPGNYSSTQMELLKEAVQGDREVVRSDWLIACVQRQAKLDTEEYTAIRENDAIPSGHGNPQSSSLAQEFNHDSLPPSNSNQIQHTGEINPIVVAKRVYDEIKKHRISEKEYGKRILELSQPRTSDLLKKPKSWENTSNKSRKHYLKMDEWIKLPLSSRLKYFDKFE